MRGTLTLLICIFGFLIHAQDYQWQASVDSVDSRLYYASPVIPNLKALGEDGPLIQTRFETSNGVDGTLVINTIGNCGSGFTRYEIQGLTSNLRFLETQVDSEKNIYIAFVPVTPGNSREPSYILKLDEQLELLWAKQLSTSDDSLLLTSFNVSSEDELYFLFSDDFFFQPAGEQKGFFLKLNKTGSVLLAKSYDLKAGTFSSTICTNDGGLLSAYDSSLVKIDQYGEIEWRASLPNRHWFVSMIEINNGYLINYNNPFGFLVQSQVIALNADGSLRQVGAFLDGFRSYYANSLNDSTVAFWGHTYYGNDFANCRLTVNTNTLDDSLICFNYPNAFGWVASWASYKKQVYFLDLVNTNSIPFLQEVRYTKLPEELDSLQCLSKNVPITSRVNQTLNISPLPIIPGQDWTPNIQEVDSLSIVQVKVDAPEVLCQKHYISAPFALSNDTIFLCSGDSLRLNGPDGYDYFWSTGEQTQSILVNEAGLYSLSVQLKCEDSIQTDSVYVIASPNINLGITGAPTHLHLGDTLSLQAYGGNSNAYDWLANSTVVDSGETLDYFCQQVGPLNVDLTYTDENGCLTIISRQFIITDEVPKMPNVFTPNNDGRNELFAPFNAEDVSYRLVIYNRFGRMVSDTHGLGWDGLTTQKKPAAEGVYFYALYWQNKPKPFKGNLSLIR